MDKKFEFCFQDKSKQNSIEFDFDGFDEQLKFRVQDNTIYLEGDSAGLLVLAKLMIKMALCGYQSGFHIHIPEDFDESKPGTQLCIGVIKP
jgi:hypothetical protein